MVAMLITSPHPTKIKHQIQEREIKGEPTNHVTVIMCSVTAQPGIMRADQDCLFRIVRKNACSEKSATNEKECAEGWIRPCRAAQQVSPWQLVQYIYKSTTLNTTVDCAVERETMECP